VPSANDGFAGVIANDTSCAGATVRVAVPVTLPDVAVIVVDPVPADPARPDALMLATDARDDVQATDEVTSCELPSV
jgi:hypothetical protein